MRKIFLLAAFIILTQAVFAQENNENTNVSVDQAKENSKGILKELFMFKMAADVLETRALISDNELGDSIENHMANYDNALFFKSTMEYDFFWNKVLGRKKYKVPSSKMFLDSKDKYLEKNEVGTSIDFDIVLTPQWENPATEDKLKDYTIEITPGNYTNLAFTTEQKEHFNTTLNSELAETYTTPKNAEVNKAVFAGLAELRTLLVDLNKPITVNLDINFKSYNEQKYGFDKLTYDVHKPSYETKKYNGKDVLLPWKSIESSGADQVLVEITDNDDSYSPDDVKFKTASGTNLSATKFEGNENIRLLNLNGKTDELTEEIIAYVNYNIDSDTKKEVAISGLNTISYDKQNISLVIVPVNGEVGFSAEEFTSELNKIYQQTVVDWKVTLDQVYTIAEEEWDQDGDHKMNDGESTFLSNYSDEQLAFKRKYKQDRGRDKNAYYVFILNNIPSKSGLAGYMPLKEQYAFIHSASNENAAQLIAHELGHGVFRLWHTFSSESNFFMAEKSSDNLMDYNKGTRLHKYQWDKVHNPDGGFYMFQDEEEGAAFGDEGTYSLCINDNTALDRINKYTIFYLPDGRIIDFQNKKRVTGFFTKKDVTESARGAVFSIKGLVGDYKHNFTASKDSTIGYGFKYNDSEKRVITKVSNFNILESSEKAVRVYIDIDNESKTITIKGTNIEEHFTFNGNCECQTVDISECEFLFRKTQVDKNAIGYQYTQPGNYFYQIILNDPCLLKGLKNVGPIDVLAGRDWEATEKYFKIVFWGGLGIAMAPMVVELAAEYLITLTTEQLVQKSVEFVSGAVIDGVIQVVILMIEGNNFDQAFQKVDLQQMLISGAENLIKPKVAAAGVSCLRDGLMEGGSFKDNLTASDFTFDCIIGAISSLAADEVSEQLGKQLKKLKGLVKSNPNKFKNSLGEFGLSNSQADNIFRQFALDDLLKRLDNANLEKEFKIDFDGFDTDLQDKFINTPEFVDCWSLLHKAGRNNLKKDPAYLSKVVNILSNTKLKSVGFKDTDITDISKAIKELYKTTPNVAKRMDNELFDNLDNIGKFLNDNVGTSFENFDKILSDLRNPSGFGTMKGANWIIKDISGNPTEFAGKKLKFNSTQNVNGTNYYVDVEKITPNKPSRYLEYKSGPGSIDKGNFIREFIKRDLKNSKITSLDQIEWRIEEPMDNLKTNIRNWLKSPDAKTSLNDAKVINIFDDFADDLGKDPIRNIDELVTFIGSNDDWFNLIFKQL